MSGHDLAGPSRQEFTSFVTIQVVVTRVRAADSESGLACACWKARHYGPGPAGTQALPVNRTRRTCRASWFCLRAVDR